MMSKTIVAVYALLLLLVEPTASFPMLRSWTCHGNNQEDLVNKLQLAKIAISPAVLQSMKRVDRKIFCPTEKPYEDAPQAIGLGQTISAPHMHARALQEIVQGLENSSSESLHILDVGCGSGYLTACLGECVNTASPILKTPGKVYGIDVFPNLIDLSQRNIQEHNSQLFDDGIISLSLGDGWKGLQGMCFDAIHVGAAASTFPPELMQQLKVGGVMIIPVGEQGAVQVLYRIKKLRENKVFDLQDYSIKKLLNVRYVPLIHPQKP